MKYIMTTCYTKSDNAYYHNQLVDEQCLTDWERGNMKAVESKFDNSLGQLVGVLGVGRSALRKTGLAYKVAE
jgi:hypothetical protein